MPVTSSAHSTVTEDFADTAVDLLIACELLIDEERFWQIVAEIDWGSNCSGDLDRLAAPLAERYRLEELVAAKLMLLDLAGEVQEAMEEHDLDAAWDSVGGEDGMEDLCNHIVGLGRREYLSVLDSPERGIAIGKSEKVVESFEYIFNFALHRYPSDDFQRALHAHTEVRQLSELGTPAYGQVVRKPDGRLGIVVHNPLTKGFQLLLPATEEEIQGYDRVEE